MLAELALGDAWPDGEEDGLLAEELDPEPVAEAEALAVEMAVAKPELVADADAEPVDVLEEVPEEVDGAEVSWEWWAPVVVEVSELELVVECVAK